MLSRGASRSKMMSFRRKVDLGIASVVAGVTTYCLYKVGMDFYDLMKPSASKTFNLFLISRRTRSSLWNNDRKFLTCNCTWFWIWLGLVFPSYNFTRLWLSDLIFVFWSVHIFLFVATTFWCYNPLEFYYLQYSFEFILF